MNEQSTDDETERAGSCITERQTPHGYWWRYKHSKGESEDTWEAATGIAVSIAAKRAAEDGKTYVVALSLPHSPAVYVFASDHPDARKVGIHTALKVTPTGERIRQPVTWQ
jgi:hypothetical protein